MMIFEWDIEKERSNVGKHGINFNAARKVFGDPEVVLSPDRVDADGEQRWHALGIAAGVGPILVVVHVYREAYDGKEIIRIISARKASRRERRRYAQ